MKKRTRQKLRIHILPPPDGFWSGFDALFDSSCVLAPMLRGYYRSTASPEELDAAAIAFDWNLVGSDFELALQAIEKGKPTTSD
jgi:hypothetical protein